MVALVVTGQLLPFEEAAPATLNPGELDAAHKQLATDPVLSAAFGLTPAAAEVRALNPNLSRSRHADGDAIGVGGLATPPACRCVRWNGGWPDLFNDRVS